MSSLPEEIYLDILLRVPVRSTFACKCVCKSWLLLISDPNFVKMHLTLTSERNSYHLMLIGFCSMSVHSISYDSLSSSNESDAVEMDLPYKSSKYGIELFGSCNGLVYGWNDQRKFFFLWNPATKEYKRLPESQYNYLGRLHGFGYDYMTDDYKLVNIQRDMEGSLIIRVYSLKSNSWKMIQSFRYGYPFSQASGVLFNGALHWFLWISKASSIVSMDISEARIVKLQLPMTLLPSTHRYMNMGVLEECLCVLAGNKETFEVWVMQDYGVSDSWNKLHSIRYENIICSPDCYMGLMGSLTNGEILFNNV